MQNSQAGLLWRSSYSGLRRFEYEVETGFRTQRSSVTHEMRSLDEKGVLPCRRISLKDFLSQAAINCWSSSGLFLIKSFVARYCLNLASIWPWEYSVMMLSRIVAKLWLLSGTGINFLESASWTTILSMTLSLSHVVMVWPGSEMVDWDEAMTRSDSGVSCLGWVWRSGSNGDPCCLSFRRDDEAQCWPGSIFAI